MAHSFKRRDVELKDRYVWREAMRPTTGDSVYTTPPISGHSIKDETGPEKQDGLNQVCHA